MTKSIKLKENIVTPVDDDGMSPNWIQLFVVEESDHSYYWVVGMDDDRRFTLHFDFVDPAAIEDATTTYASKLTAMLEREQIKW